MKLKISKSKTETWEDFILNHPAYDAEWDQGTETYAGPTCRRRLENLVLHGGQPDVWKMARILSIIVERDYTVHIINGAARWHDVKEAQDLLFDYSMADKKLLSTWLELHIFGGNLDPEIVNSLMEKGAQLPRHAIEALIISGPPELLTSLVKEEKIQMSDLTGLAQKYLKAGSPAKDYLDIVMAMIPNELRHELLSPYASYEVSASGWEKAGEHTIIRTRTMPHNLTSYEIYDFFAEDVKYVTRYSDGETSSLSQTIRNFNDLARQKDILERAAEELLKAKGNPSPHHKKTLKPSAKP